MAYAKAIELNSDDVKYLQSLVRTRTIQAQVVDRAKMLLYKAKGESNRSIATRLDVNIKLISAFPNSKKVACSVLFLMLNEEAGLQKLQTTLLPG